MRFELNFCHLVQLLIFRFLVILRCFRKCNITNVYSLAICALLLYYYLNERSCYYLVISVSCASEFFFYMITRLYASPQFKAL